MKKAAWCILSWALIPWAAAQWEVPGPIVLDGAGPEDRQVLGVAHPSSPNAAMSIDALRNNVVLFGEATGDQELELSIDPSPTEYVMGMQVVFITAQPNRPAPTLNVNDLGSVPLVKADGMPLDSADLLPGMPARAIYDGSAFQLMNSSYLKCPPGYFASSTRTCIQSTSRDSTTFFQAAELCRAEGARLCGLSEWIHACTSQPSFLGTVFGGEWVDSAANEQSGAKYMGTGVPGGPSGGHTGAIGCQYGYFVVPTANRRFRCCTTR